MPVLKPLPAPLTRIPFTNQTARRAGIGPERLRSRDLVAPFQGVHARIPDERGRDSSETSSEEDALARCRAFALLLRPDECFSHTTAALLWGAALPRSTLTAPLHVSIPDPARARRARGVVGHTMPEAPTRERLGLPVTDPALTWLASAPLLPADELIALGDHLVRVPVYTEAADPRPYVTLDELAARVASASGRGAARARAALPLLSDASESRPETLLRLLLHRGGLPDPEVNPEVLDAAGHRIGRADLLFRRYRLIVEYDGQQHRLNDTQYEKDAVRLERFHLDGWFVIRVRKAGLFQHPERTVVHVRDILQQRGWVTTTVPRPRQRTATPSRRD